MIQASATPRISGQLCDDNTRQPEVIARMGNQDPMKQSLLLALFGTAAVVGLTSLLQGQHRTEQPAPRPQVASTQPVTTQPAATSRPAQMRPTSRPADPEPRREPTPSEILRQLTKTDNAAPRPIVRPVQPGQEQVTVAPTALPANAIAPLAQKLMPDGYRVVDRPGRLTREGDYWVLSFESRGRGETELPIRLLPNRLLEDMEMASSGGTKEVVFIISGEVTEYHGVNYLLVQKLLTRPDLGNLK
jgi:hypothetical protein